LICWFFFKAGDNFEFQVPSNAKQGVAPFSFQSANVVLVDSGIADTNEKILSTMYSKDCIGEHILSIKQILNKCSQLFWSGVISPFEGKNHIQVSPYFYGLCTQDPLLGTFQYPPLFGDWFSFMAPMYTYQRGGIRYLLTNDNDPISGHVLLGNMPGAPFLAPGPIGTANIRNGSTDAVVSTYGTSHIWPGETALPDDLAVGLNYVELPYYNRYPVTFQHPASFAYFSQTDRTMPSSILSITKEAVFGHSPMLYRSCSDDFQFSFFIGCPPLLTALT